LNVIQEADGAKLGGALLEMHLENGTYLGSLNIIQLSLSAGLALGVGVCGEKRQMIARQNPRKRATENGSLRASPAVSTSQVLGENSTY
jgi:hypothetical protein